MVNYFTAADVADLNEYAAFAKGLPASLVQFRKTINLRPLANWVRTDQFQTKRLKSDAIAQANIWLKSPAIFETLHTEAQTLTGILSWFLKSLPSQRQPYDSSQFDNIVEVACNGTLNLLNELSKQQESMLRVTTNIYAVLPRFIDYMYSCIYEFSGLQNQLLAANSGAYDAYKNSFLTVFIPGDAKGTRRIEALNLIDTYQRMYVNSYAAASNVTGHFTRLKELAVTCVEQALALRGTRNTSTLRVDIRILLHSLTEIQRISAQARRLFFP